MFTLPENNFYRVLLFTATVFLTVVYAWMGSTMMAPAPSFPPSFISTVTWLSGTKSTSPESAPSFNWLEYERMAHEVRDFAASMEAVGDLKKPMKLIINLDEPRILRIDEGNIEIGFDLAKAHGQLSKALAKSWIFQNTNVAISSSLLRTEAVSDALVLLLDRTQSLENADRKTLQIERSGPQNWITYAGSIEDICVSPWALAELQALCKTRSDGEGEISPLAFRPFLTEWIVAHFEHAPQYKQIQFFQEWVAHLKSSTVDAEKQDDFYKMKSFNQWRDRLRIEAMILVPQSLARLSEAEPNLLEQARLLPTQISEFNLVIRQNSSVRAKEPSLTYGPHKKRVAKFYARLATDLPRPTSLNENESSIRLLSESI